MKMKKMISCVGAAAIALTCMTTVSFAEVTTTDDDTCTYYFLAPDSWVDKAHGAQNEDVGCYWWDPEENAAWPGQKLTPAPEVGKNVFKIKDVPKDVTTIIFNDHYNYDTHNMKERYVTSRYVTSVNVNTEGYETGDCIYNKDLTTDSFDGWICVLQEDNIWKNECTAPYYPYAWFTLNDYKNHDDFYGSYSRIPDIVYPETEDKIMGDADYDGVITADDALVILRASLSKDDLSERFRALHDVDRDAYITTNDALLVLRHSVGMGSNEYIGKVVTYIVE